MESYWNCQWGETQLTKARMFNLDNLGKMEFGVVREKVA